MLSALALIRRPRTLLLEGIMAHRISLAALAAAATLAVAATLPSFAQEVLPWSQGGATSGSASHSQRMNVGANDAYRPSGEGYDTGAAPSANDDAYRPDQGGGEPSSNSSEAYRPDDRSYGGSARRDSFSDPAQRGGAAQDNGGYGEAYSPPPQTYEDANRGQGPSADPRHTEGFEQGEIIGAGHRFFGGVSGGIANAVESIFKSQGRPNGYILGEDAGGAFILGLRYGEGTLYTKDAGEHRVFWQGPSIGYDAGGDGSKTMVLVYNLRDPAEIYERFGGVQGAAYVVGGVSVQYQRYNDVTLAVIRSGLGLRLGANVGYSKYTRQPTWNPL
jgi:hypothetical protein